MADLSVLNDILSTRNTLVAIASIMTVALWRAWTGLPAVMQQWIAHRQAIVAEKDAAWKRLRDEIERYAARQLLSEERHDECERNLAAEREARHLAVTELRDELAAEHAERMKFQAILDGHGEVRQAAAAAAAEARHPDASMAPESAKAAERVRRMRGGENGDGI